MYIHISYIRETGTSLPPESSHLLDLHHIHLTLTLHKSTSIPHIIPVHIRSSITKNPLIDLLLSPPHTPQYTPKIQNPKSKSQITNPHIPNNPNQTKPCPHPTLLPPVPYTSPSPITTPSPSSCLFASTAAPKPHTAAPKARRVRVKRQRRKCVVCVDARN
jgi:hypothetical protein